VKGRIKSHCTPNSRFVEINTKLNIYDTIEMDKSIFCNSVIVVISLMFSVTITNETTPKSSFKSQDVEAIA
jgi:alpha-N-acetylglucosamine transferase